jgi:hypothetical protein
VSLAERLQNSDKNKSTSGLPCPLGRLLVTLPDDDGKALAVVLNAPQGDKDWLPSSAVVNALREEGHHVGQTAVQRHRRQMCRCYGTNPKV